MKNRFVLSIQVAAIYIGTVVGAGFATGREIVEFFTKYGPSAFISIIFCTALLTWYGMKVMVIGYRLKATSYQQVTAYLFGPFLASVFNVIMFVTLLGVTSVMISGAGAIFKEQLNLSSQVGILFTIGLTMAVLKFGVKGISSVNMVVVPIFILFSFLLALHALPYEMNEPFQLSSMPLSIFSSFLYAAFNLALAQAVLVPLATEVNDEKAIKFGAIFGGIGLGIILMASHLALSNLTNVGVYDIPMAQLIKEGARTFYLLYVIVICGEVFTSVIGNVYGIEKQMKSNFRKSTFINLSIISVVTYSISLIGYSELITKLYPLFGYVSLSFLLVLMVKKVP
ncbi:hypothetical protein [Bacillus kexueae]|uniref:YkvI family membrane protein n=1 Tax=Aeribacillus kexueae TaxID=2078952 RepID=UPI001FAFD611|nr:hypothetical protein [Bacillus kexueae]